MEAALWPTYWPGAGASAGAAATARRPHGKCKQLPALNPRATSDVVKCATAPLSTPLHVRQMTSLRTANVRAGSVAGPFSAAPRSGMGYASTARLPGPALTRTSDRATRRDGPTGGGFSDIASSACFTAQGSPHALGNGSVGTEPGGRPDSDSLVQPSATATSGSSWKSDEAGASGVANALAHTGLQLRGRRRLRSERTRTSGTAAPAADKFASDTAVTAEVSVLDSCTSRAVIAEADALLTAENRAAKAAAAAGSAEAQAPGLALPPLEPQTAEEWCHQVMALAAEHQRLQAGGPQQPQRSVRPQKDWLAAFMRVSLLQQAPLGSGETVAQRGSAGPVVRPGARPAGDAAGGHGLPPSSAATENEWPARDLVAIAKGRPQLPLRLLVGAMSALDILYPRGEWLQLELNLGNVCPEPGAVSQVDVRLVGAPLLALPPALSGQAQPQRQGTEAQNQAGQGQRHAQNKADGRTEAHVREQQPWRGEQPLTLQAQWLAAWWQATAAAARHRQSWVQKDTAVAGRRAATAPVPDGEAEAARDLELVQLLQYVTATQPELRAQTAATGADGGWLGGSWHSGRALRRVAVAPGPVGTKETGSEQGHSSSSSSSSRGSLAVVAAVAAGRTPQPPNWWRAAVGHAVEERLTRSPSEGSGAGSPVQPQGRGRTTPAAGAATIQVAALEARVALLRAYAGTGLWPRRRVAALTQGQKQQEPRVNPASAVMQLVLTDWAAQQGSAAQGRPRPLSTSGLAALLRSQQLLGAPLAPAAAAAAVQMLEVQATDLQPLPLATLSDILAGVSTCPRPLPPSAAVVLAAAAQRSLHVAPNSAAGPEQLRRDGPVLLELLKSLARLWARRQQQLQRAGQCQSHRHTPAANAYEAALDACLPPLRRWLDSCSAAELLVASRSLIAALRMRPCSGGLGSAEDAGNADDGYEDEYGQGWEAEAGAGAERDVSGRKASVAAHNGVGAGLGQAGTRQRRAAGPPAPPAPALSAAWAAFEAASSPLLEGVLPGWVLLQLAVDVSFMQNKSDVAPRYKVQLLRALTAAMEQSARRQAGMRGPAPSGRERGATAARQQGDRDPAPEHAAARTSEGPDGDSGNSSGDARSPEAGAYTRPQRPRIAARQINSRRASGAGSSSAQGCGSAASEPASSATASQLLSPDQVAHAAAAAARLLSQDRFVPAAVARRMQAAVLVAAQAMKPRELCLALAALGELQLTGLTPTGSELLLKVLAARLPDLPPSSLPLLLWSLARMRLRPPSQWLAAYSRVVQQHVLSYDMRQVAQLVWSYGQLVPQAPYSKMYFRPPRSLVRGLLRRCLASFTALESRALRLRSSKTHAASQSTPRSPREQPARRVRPPASRPTSVHYSQLRPADCALVVAGLAGLEARPDSRWLQGLYRWSGPLLPSFRASELGMLLYGLARLEAVPPPAWVRRAAHCVELQLFHATGLDTAYTAYGLARLRPMLVSRRLLTALEVFVPLQLQNGAQEALRVGGVQAQQEVEAAWADFLRTAHRELREAATSAMPERGSGLQRAGVKARRGSSSVEAAADLKQGADEQRGRVETGVVRLCRLDTGTRCGLAWTWRRR